jgi:hypothetical protein
MRYQEERENCIMRFIMVLVIGDIIKGNQMGETCSMHARDEKGVQNFSQKT